MLLLSLEPLLSFVISWLSICNIKIKVLYPYIYIYDIYVLGQVDATAPQHDAHNDGLL